MGGLFISSCLRQLEINILPPPVCLFACFFGYCNSCVASYASITVYRLIQNQPLQIGEVDKPEKITPEMTNADKKNVFS